MERLFGDRSNRTGSHTYEGRFCVQGKIGGKIMGRIVMKFGGTSVANPERIARAATACSR